MRKTNQVTRKVQFSISGDHYPMIVNDVWFGLDKIDLNEETDVYAQNIIQSLALAKVGADWVIGGDNDDLKAWTLADIEKQQNLPLKKVKKADRSIVYRFEMTCNKRQSDLTATEFSYHGDCGSYALDEGFYSDFVEKLSLAVERCLKNPTLELDTGWLSFKKTEATINIQLSGRKVEIMASSYIDTDSPHEMLESICWHNWEKELHEIEVLPQIKAYKSEYQIEGSIVEFLVDTFICGEFQSEFSSSINFRVTAKTTEATVNKILKRAAMVALNAAGQADREFDRLAGHIKEVIDESLDNLPGKTAA
ncbi:MAG: hypothetical protein ACRC62_07405 [Microcoleus sp.]